jgi:ubiquinone/menaquinone biosynthesis C-methylase UbiE
VDLHIEKMQSLAKYKNVNFLRQDLSYLAFLSGTFSLIYCYHVLEHVQDPITVLRELNRVLKPGGVLFIGFPNKKRIVSYIGTSQKVSNFERIKWNLNDYKYRLQGKFDNKFGAHAGFTKAEFIIASKPIFDVVHAMEDKYMLYKYPRLAKVIQLFIKTSLDEYIFPSNYFICMKF